MYCCSKLHVDYICYVKTSQERLNDATSMPLAAGSINDIGVVKNEAKDPHFEGIWGQN